jgi:chromate transporter
VDRIPSFGGAFRYWPGLDLVNVRGPAAQTAMVHEDLVERLRWIAHERFQHALNDCTLPPGPETMRLATYVGRLLHGTAWGLEAGILLVLPGALARAALSIAYVLPGDPAWMRGIFTGLGPAFLALAASAVLRLVMKSLPSGPLRGPALGAFIALFLSDAPFPAVVLGAALLGLAATPKSWVPAPPAAEAVQSRLRREPAIHPALRASPLAALAAFRGPDDLFLRLGLFLSAATMVTFGGAYAVPAYVAQAAVQGYGWLTASDMPTPLGPGEPTPGAIQRGPGGRVRSANADGTWKSGVAETGRIQLSQLSAASPRAPAARP